MKHVAKVAGSLCLGASLWFSGAATGAQWETVARAADETVFVDLDSLRKVGAYVEAQGLHSYEQPRNLGPDWFVHRSRLMWYRFDCGSEKLAFTAFEMKSGELGSGDTVFAGTTGADLFPAAAHALDLKLMGKVCSPSSVARAHRQGTEEARLASR